MATVKVTFTLDEAAIRQLEQAAERLARSKSDVVREAIGEFHGRLDRMSDRERAAKLKAFDELLPLIPYRSGEEVAAEIRDVRSARRQGGRRTKQLNPA